MARCSFFPALCRSQHSPADQHVSQQFIDRKDLDPERHIWILLAKSLVPSRPSRREQGAAMMRSIWIWSRVKHGNFILYLVN
jgi:hypothetical protein